MNNTTLKKSNEIENSTKSTFGTAKLIFESSTFSSTKLNPQIFKSSHLTLSYTGGGVEPNFSAVGRKQQFPQSNGANSAVGKKLSIVNCALLILFCFLFAGSLSAQDNYSVVVKCYPSSNSSSGYAMHAYGSHPYTWSSYSRGWKSGGKATIGTKKTFVLTTGTICAYLSTSTGTASRTYNGTTWRETGPVTYYSSVVGWGNFSITNINSNCFTLNSMSLVYYQTLNSNNSINYYNPSVSPPCYTSYNNSTISYRNGEWGVDGDCYSYYSGDMRNYYSSLNVANNAGTGWKSNTLTTARLSSALTNGRTDFMIVVSPSTGRFEAYPANVANKPYLAVQYSAPWSCVITPSVNPNTSSVCANDGVFTLTATQSVNTNYISISPVSWQWYSATASGGPYATLGTTTTASTYAVTAPSNTGSIWYKYYQTINYKTNSTLETKYNTGSITYCKPGSILISMCCTSLGSNPTFSATQVSDRSVTLTWSGMNNVDHYVIRYGVEGGISYNEITVAGNATSKLIERLTNGRTYYFQIQAIGASGYCDTQLSTKTYLTPECNE